MPEGPYEALLTGWLWLPMAAYNAGLLMALP